MLLHTLSYISKHVFSQDGMTALHLAADGGHYECTRLLLEARCNVNELSNVGSLTHSWVIQVQTKSWGGFLLTGPELPKSGNTLQQPQNEKYL